MTTGSVLERYVDEQLANIEARPAMYGDALAIDATCRTLVETYDAIVLDGTGASLRYEYARLKRERFPWLPEPLVFAEYSTGTKIAQFYTVTAEEARAIAADMNDPRGDEPIDVDVHAHLRWLETGEGEAWPRRER